MTNGRLLFANSTEKDVSVVATTTPHSPFEKQRPTSLPSAGDAGRELHHVTGAVDAAPGWASMRP